MQYKQFYKHEVPKTILTNLQEPGKQEPMTIPRKGIFYVEISLAKGIIFTKMGLANGSILKLWAAHRYLKFSREPPSPGGSTPIVA